MKLGIVGLPNVVRAHFLILDESGSGIGHYPFCTIDPNIALWRAG